MGNVGFWVETIIMDEEITPTNENFRLFKATHYRLCPLIWDKIKHSGFVNGKVAADFFQHLIQENILPAKTLEDACNNIKRIYDADQDLQNIFCQLFRGGSEDKSEDNFNTELQHYGLDFAKNFSYDIILPLSDLATGLGISESNLKMERYPYDFIQMKIADKLGIYSSQKKKKNGMTTALTESIFQHWIIFNARKQLF